MSNNIMNTFENTLNSIRDILRKEGVTGMDSIKHCLFFVLMKYLSKIKCKLFDIDTKYSFEEIMKLTDPNELQERVYISKRECLVNILKNKNIFWVEYKLSSSMNLLNILKKVNEINFDTITLQADIVGMIYELHLKSGTSQAMRDLGQYFTNRLIIIYMVQLCKPTIKNKKTGEIEKVLDPSMGTGGFLIMAMKYLNEQHKKIDWSVNKNNIYGFDIDDNVKSMALLNAFIETGEFFNTTLIKHNTLEKDYVLNDGTVIDKVDVILANEPFGLKNIVHADCCERIKELKIRGTKAEPLFLQLMMLSLNNGGRCAVVVPDGVLFNDSNLHTGTRKYLVENLNLKKVISLNGDFFMNTGVKSSILFFVNDGQTKETEFSDIVFENGGLKENSIIKVDYKTLVKNDYSLFVNKYNVVKEAKLNGIQYKKLGEIADINFGTRIKRSEVEPDNNYKGELYPCYGGGDISFYMKEYNREGLNVLVSRFGVSENCVRIVNQKLWLNDSGMSIHTKKDSCYQKYLNYYLKLKQYDIYNLAAGACQKNINIDDFKNMEIPIPSLNKQKEIVEMLDIIYEQIERNNQSIKAYELIKKSIVWANTQKNCEEKKFNECVEYLPKKINIKQGDAKDQGKYKFYTNGVYKNLYVDTCMYDFKAIIFGFVGNIAIHMDSNFSIMDREVYAIITNSMKLEYLYYYLSFVKNNIEKLTHSTTINRISKDLISDFPIKIPSKEIQEKIVKECEYYDEQINRLNQENNNLKSMNIIEACLLAESKEDQTQEPVLEEPDIELEQIEIEIKGKQYILDRDTVYFKTDQGTKGEVYGTYKDGKVKKIKKEIDL
jgi:type I restriction-modification system DNA methylase subunit/restriction endonuclease S subunit